MATRTKIKTTFEVNHTIQPIYLGGALDLDRSGSVLATSLGEEVLITDVDTGKVLGKIEGDDEPVTSLSITPTASHLIICSRSISMRVYSLNYSDEDPRTVNIQLLRTVKPHTAPVVVTAIDQSGTLLATGAADGSVKVWDIRGGYATHTFHGHSGLVTALHFFETPRFGASRAQGRGKRGHEEDEEMQDSTDSSPLAPGMFRLASGGEDGKVRIWDLDKKKALATLDSHVSLVRSLCYSPDDNSLVSGSRDKTVIVWDARSWKPKRVIPVLETVEAAGFLNNGNVIYTGGETGRLRLWAVDTGREVTSEQTIGADDDGIYTVIHCSSRQWLISVHADQTLRIHSLTPLSELKQGESIQHLPIISYVSGNYDDVIDLSYAGPDQSLLALATNSETLRLVSLSSENNAASSNASLPHKFGSDVAHLKGHGDIIICLDVDWSGHWLATGAKDRTAKLWRLDPDSSSFDCYATFSGHTETIGAIALPKMVPPTSSVAHSNPLMNPPPFLLTGSQDRTIKRWNIPKPGPSGEAFQVTRALYTRKAHDKDINALDINSDSTLFASASQDKLVKIWSFEDGESTGVLRGHKRGVWTAKFAPPSSASLLNVNGGMGNSHRGLILTGSGDKTVKIWNLSDYSCIRTLEGHTASVLKVVWLHAVSTDSKEPNATKGHSSSLVASAAGDGLVKVWDAASGEVECTLDNHTDRIWALAIHPSPTNNTLVSGGGDSIINIWGDTTAATIAAVAAASTARIEQDQQLQNYMHAGSYREAITLALQLNHPARLLALLKSAVNKQPPEEQSITGVRAVDEVLASLGSEQLWLLLLQVRDWNTNAKTAPVAQRILNVLIRIYGADVFAKLRATKTSNTSSAKEVFSALEAYTERHYRRMEELVDESYLVEYTLKEMEEVSLVDNIVA